MHVSHHLNVKLGTTLIKQLENVIFVHQHAPSVNQEIIVRHAS